jgi:hypothetical protein
MTNRFVRVPPYRLKKRGKCRYAVVSLPDGRGGRRDVILGQFGTKEFRVPRWTTRKSQIPRSTIASKSKETNTDPSAWREI